MGFLHYGSRPTFLKKKERKKNTKTKQRLSFQPTFFNRLILPATARAPHPSSCTASCASPCAPRARLSGSARGGAQRSTRPTIWCSLDAGGLVRRRNATMHACNNEYARLPLPPIPAAVSSGGKQTLLEKPRHVCAGKGCLRKCRVR